MTLTGSITKGRKSLVKNDKLVQYIQTLYFFSLYTPMIVKLSLPSLPSIVKPCSLAKCKTQIKQKLVESSLTCSGEYIVFTLLITSLNLISRWDMPLLSLDDEFDAATPSVMALHMLSFKSFISTLLATREKLTNSVLRLPMTPAGCEFN